MTHSLIAIRRSIKIFWLLDQSGIIWLRKPSWQLYIWFSFAWWTCVHRPLVSGVAGLNFAKLNRIACSTNEYELYIVVLCGYQLQVVEKESPLFICLFSSFHHLVCDFYKTHATCLRETSHLAPRAPRLTPINHQWTFVLFSCLYLNFSLRKFNSLWFFFAKNLFERSHNWLHVPCFSIINRFDIGYFPADICNSSVNQSCYRQASKEHFLFFDIVL